VRLMARPLATSTRPRALFTAILDVTEEHRLTVERQKLWQREQQRSAELAAEVTTRIAAEERIKGLLARVVAVQEEERARFARNLHDQLGQQMTSLRIAISTLRQGVSGNGAVAHFDRIERMLTDLDRDLDFLAWEMRPAALDDMGLEDALRAFLDRWSSLHQVPVEFHAAARPRRRLPTDVESHLYRILQEALNNVSKHAHASRVSVTLQRQPKEVTLLVEDDGTGVDTTTLQRAKERGMGLAGIEERAALLGGTVEFESSLNKGAALFVCIPL
jgi:signal transduction histidine kinase